MRKIDREVARIQNNVIAYVERLGERPRKRAEGSVDIDLEVCNWRMPVDVQSLDKKIADLQKIRNAFVERWSDTETGKLTPTVKAVYNLTCSLARWDHLSDCCLAIIFDKQISKFTKPYTEHGKRPLPKGRYE